MAKRRSFSERVLGSDAYAALTFEAQALYMALSMAADDEGMVGAPLHIARSVGLEEEELAALTRAGFIIRFASGVVAVTHFHANNYIPEGRRRRTEYAAERALLTVTETGEYALADTLHANCMQSECDTLSPLSLPPFPPSSFSPCTPLSITPYDPHPIPFSPCRRRQGTRATRARANRGRGSPRRDKSLACSLKTLDFPSLSVLQW